MNFKYALCILTAIGLLSVAAAAQRTFTIGSPATENFDTLGTGAVSLTNNTTINGVYAVRTTGNATPNSLPANNGSTNTGSLYNMGTTGAGDRALGTVSTTASGTNHLGLRLVNTGPNPIGSIQVQYTGEEWRHGNGANETLTFEYQTGATVTSLTTGTWTSVTALNFISPTNPPGQGALDGNAAANRTVLTATIPVSIPVGTEIMLRWTDIVDSAQPDGFGIDDITVSAIAPTAAGAIIAGRVTDGYGRAISSAAITIQDFTGNSKTFYTNTFGYYRTTEFEVGQSYVISISARRYTFSPAVQLVSLSNNIAGFNFVAVR